MEDEYDFKDAKRGPIASAKGKTRITIMLDDVVIEAARTVAASEGFGYQTVINNTLRQALLSSGRKSTVEASHNSGANAIHIKEGITTAELKSLGDKLADALSEIHRVMKP